MRRLLVIFALLTSLVSSAQRQYSPNFAVGAKGGVTLSMLSISPSIDQKLTTGFTGGLVARYMEENHFGLIGEVNITQRGWKEDFTETPEFSYSRTLTYIQIPLLTHIYFGSPKARFFVNLGPEVGILLGDKISANFDYRNPSEVTGFPLHNRQTLQMGMDIHNRFDYGIAAGLGGEFIANRRHSFMVEGRFYYGLGNIFPSAKKDHFSASRSMSIEITAAYLFRLR